MDACLSRPVESGRNDYPRVTTVTDSALRTPHSALVAARRHFFQQCRVGIGAMALGSLLKTEQASGATDATDPVAASQPHFAPRAKSVIFLFMAGGPSQLELFDPKPKLQELDGQVIPPSFVANKRFAFIKPDAKL